MTPRIWAPRLSGLHPYHHSDAIFFQRGLVIGHFTHAHHSGGPVLLQVLRSRRQLRPQSQGLAIPLHESCPSLERTGDPKVLQPPISPYKGYSLSNSLNTGAQHSASSWAPALSCVGLGPSTVCPGTNCPLRPHHPSPVPGTQPKPRLQTQLLETVLGGRRGPSVRSRVAGSRAGGHDCMVARKGRHQPSRARSGPHLLPAAILGVVYHWPLGLAGHTRDSRQSEAGAKLF